MKCRFNKTSNNTSKRAIANVPALKEDEKVNNRKSVIRIFVAACKAGMWSQVQRLMQFQFTQEELKQSGVFWKTAYAEKTSILAFLAGRYDFTEDASRAFHEAVDGGKCVAASWLQERFNIISSTEHQKQYLKNAVYGSGSVFMVQWLLTLSFDSPLTKEDALDIFFTALWRGHLASVKLLANQFSFTTEDVTNGDKAGWFSEIIYSGSHEMVEWFAKHFNLTRKHAMAKNNAFFYVAMRQGDLPMLKWVTEYFNITAKDVVKDYPPNHYLGRPDCPRHAAVLPWLREFYAR